jgi:hypothetical protein
MRKITQNKKPSQFLRKGSCTQAPFALIVQGLFPCFRLAPSLKENSPSTGISSTAGCWVSLGLSLHQLGIREYPFKSQSYATPKKKSTIILKLSPP